jgi:type 2 lantibiotic biosynthesis protein LanM
MKEVLPETSIATRTQQHSARWYQAATLTERVPFLKQHGSRPPAEQISQERASQRLARWKSLPPFRRSEQVFQQRLELDGLNEADLLALLAQPAEEIQATCSEAPAWLEELLKAFVQPDPAILACLPLQNAGDPPSDAVFQAVKPLLARGFARLQTEITDLQQRHAKLPFDPHTVGSLLLPHFIDQVLNKPAKALMLELNVARVQGRLQGETPEARFLFFLQQLGQPEKMLSFLEEYPVLARQLVEMIDRWVVRELELLQRLCTDWDEMHALFAPMDDPGLLSEIKEGAGDPHQGGRSVCILTWSSGLRLVYKPRPLAIDVHFQELLAWLNDHDCQPAFRTARLLDKEGYGWYEYFTASGCASQEQVERFYQRAGGYLALLYTLDATDFHAENLIAAGEDPMFVDLESLFQPYAEKYEGTDTYGYELLTHSVRRVGLLPQRQWLNGDAANIDLSGLGAPSQGASVSANSWSGLGTDNVQPIKEQVELKLGDHRPTLQGEQVNTLAYVQHIVAGFTTVYRLLLQQREELLHDILPRFAHDRIRVLFRPTNIYALLQSDSLHPDVLRDALDREWLFDRLWIAAMHAPHLARLIAAERADLQNGDIPKFTTAPDSRDIFTARGECIADYLPASSLDMVSKNIQTLSEGDLARQAWIIQASFVCMELNSSKVTPKHALQLDLTHPRASREAFLAEAMAIGERLRELALITDDTIGWLVLNLVGGQEWRPVPAGPDLYNGLPGIALFLAYLGELSGEQRYTDMARLAVQTLRAIFLPKAHLWQWGTIGAFDGLGALIYLFAHLGTLWHDPTLYQEAEEIIPPAMDLLQADKACDLLEGAAGCLTALLSLYAVAPSEATLTAATQCGEHILSRVRTMSRGIAWSPEEDAVPLTGLSHGNAGIALSLLRLTAVTGDERFQQTALAALEYERSLFSAEKRNWPDLRDVETLPEASNPESFKCMTAWCHGAMGIGLGRLASLQYHDDAAIRAEIDAAVQTTLSEGFGRNHSLCHGDMGNLDLLLLATQLLPEKYSRAKTEPLQAGLLATMRAQGWLSGIARPIEMPGLMLGLAGTGYALLRLADPERVPSILVLDPPKGANQ